MSNAINVEIGLCQILCLNDSMILVYRLCAQKM